jgi:anti-anti-sigma factor
MSAAPIQLSGVLGFATVADALARLGSGAAGVVDLSAVSHIDSAGLALLLELKRRSVTLGERLVIRGASAQVCELADFFGLEPVLDLRSQAPAA